MKHLEQQPGIYCLNKGWKFIEKDLSVLPPTKQHDEVYGFAKGGANKGPADASYDDSEWEEVKLPHDWVVKKEFEESGSPNQGYKERGVGWYRIKFNLTDEDRDKQILLEFEGASCDAVVYVNGMLLKRSFSGYNSFQVDMTDMAHFGVVPNTLAVYVNASAWEGWWYEGAGIYRNVWLVKKEAVHIAYNGVYIKPVKLSNHVWDTKIEVTVENSFEFSKAFTIETYLMDSDNNQIGKVISEAEIAPYEVTSFSQSIEVEKPILWDIDNPRLYRAKSIVRDSSGKEDYLVTNYGYRSIHFDAKNGFYLNDKSMKLKGFCNHQDHAGVGAAVPYAIKEYRVGLLKELGANSYRLAHNPDPEILEICDKLGMMVMEENRTFNSSKDTMEDLAGIVINARNHPSVIMYSIFNEEPLQGTAKGRRMAGRMQAVVKQLDDTRVVLGAFNGGYMEEEGASTILDMTGINYNPARYDDFHGKYPNTLLIGSETASAFMVRGEYKTDMEKHLINCYDDECALWGNTIKEAWKYVNERPFVAGTFVWTGFDYRGEPTPFEWPSVATFFGTYDSCGFEKDACYFYKAFWKSEPMVHLLPHWSLEVEEGSNVRVMAITNCEEVALYLNDKLIGRKDADQYEQVNFEVPYEKGSIKAIGYINGKEVVTDSKVTASTPKTVKIGLSKRFMSADELDSVAVNVWIEDEAGNMIPTGNHMIRFEVEGSGEIIGVGNGDPNSHEPDCAPFRKLYNGFAQAIIQNNGNEDVTVTVRAEGLNSASVTIEVVNTESIPYMKAADERIIDGWKMYYKLFDQMPDANPKVDANDMNSFEPVTFHGSVQPQLSNQLGKYGLYRAVFEAGKAIANRNLYFGGVIGHVWIYIDGKEILSRRDKLDGYLSYELPIELSGEHVLTVIVKNANKEWPHAGICNPVTIKVL